ncbi:MAG: alpha/beta hydrolase [Rhodospirillaceae bacterium]
MISAKSDLDFVPGSPRIAYERAGSGPVVVFLHGIGGNRSNWADQCGALADRFTTVAWDARGYGASADYPGDLEFSEFGDDLNRLLDWLEVETAHLVGLSMGGRILLDFQPRYADRIATLTLCDTHFGFETALSEEKRAEFLRLRQQPLLEGKSFADLAPALLDSLLGPNCGVDARERLEESLLELRKESYLKTLAASIYFDASNDLSDIDVPVLLIYGEFDRLTSPEIGRQLEDRIRDARLEIIPDAGHLSNLEQPDRFNAVLGPFLDTHADRATKL